MSENTLLTHFKDTDNNKYPSNCQNLVYCGLCNSFYSKGFLSTGDHLISDNHLRCFGINEDSRDKRWNKFKDLCNHNLDFLTKHLLHGFSSFIEKNIFSTTGLYDSKIRIKDKFKIKVQKNQIHVSLYCDIYQEIEKLESKNSIVEDEFNHSFFEYNYEFGLVSKLLIPNYNPILSKFNKLRIKKKNPRRIKEKKLVPNYYELYHDLISKNILPKIKPDEKRIICNTTFLHYLCNNNKFDFIISKASDNSIIINNVIPNNRFWNINDIGCILENRILGIKKETKKRTYKITKFNIDNVNLFVISEVDCVYCDNGKVTTIEIKSRKSDKIKKISQKNFVQLYSLQADYQYEYSIRDEGNSYSINNLVIKDIKEEMSRKREKINNIELKINEGIRRVLEYPLPFSLKSTL